MADDITVSIDWEQQASNPEQIRVNWNAGPVSGGQSFVVQDIGKKRTRTVSVQKEGEGGVMEQVVEEIEPTAKEAELAQLQGQVAADLEPVIDALRDIEIPAPTFRDKPVGDPPKLIRVIISEGAAKALVDGELVKAANVIALWGEPANPTRRELTSGGDLADLLSMVLSSAHELAEAHLG